MTDRGTTSAVKPLSAFAHDDVRVDASFTVVRSRQIGPLASDAVEQGDARMS